MERDENSVAHDVATASRYPPQDVVTWFAGIVRTPCRVWILPIMSEN